MYIEPLTPDFGAIIHDIQLSHCNDEQAAEIYDIFLNYQVIFFRNQHLSPSQQLAVAARFGELEPPHPFFPHLDNEPQVTVIKTSPGIPPGESFWHTDLSWQTKPAKCSVLYAHTVPPKGGGYPLDFHATCLAAPTTNFAATIKGTQWCPCPARF